MAEINKWQRVERKTITLNRIQINRCIQKRYFLDLCYVFIGFRIWCALVSVSPAGTECICVDAGWSGVTDAVCLRFQIGKITHSPVKKGTFYSSWQKRYYVGNRWNGASLSSYLGLLSFYLWPDNSAASPCLFFYHSLSWWETDLLLLLVKLLFGQKHFLFYLKLCLGFFSIIFYVFLKPWKPLRKTQTVPANTSIYIKSPHFDEHWS